MNLIMGGLNHLSVRDFQLIICVNEELNKNIYIINLFRNDKIGVTGYHMPIYL